MEAVIDELFETRFNKIEHVSTTGSTNADLVARASTLPDGFLLVSDYQTDGRGRKGRKWDAHGNRGGLVGNHRDNAGRTDQGITALILDLKARGMLEETLVVWATEFGRTPFEEANREARLGRGHHHKGFTLWMAGGGVKGGTSLGATDEFGMHAVEKAVHVHDVHATILHLLGLHHHDLFFERNGLKERLTDPFKPRLVKEVLA